MATPCRTFIVDDDDDMVFLTTTLIETANEGLSVAGVARSASEAIRLVPGAAPDVVVMDHRMPGGDGLSAAAHLLADEPELDIVLFSAYLDDDTVAEAARVGIRECVSKDRASALPDILRKYCAAA